LRFQRLQYENLHKAYVKHFTYKLHYQQLHLNYVCNLARHWSQAPWGWHDSVETRMSVIICEIIVHLLITAQNTHIFLIKTQCTSTVLQSLVLSHLVLLIMKWPKIFIIFSFKTQNCIFFFSNQHACSPDSEVSTANKPQAEKFVVRIPREL
jgi:hypothetical protein